MDFWKRANISQNSKGGLLEENKHQSKLHLRTKNEIKGNVPYWVIFCHNHEGLWLCFVRQKILKNKVITKTVNWSRFLVFQIILVSRRNTLINCRLWWFSKFLSFYVKKNSTPVSFNAATPPVSRPSSKQPSRAGSPVPPSSPVLRDASAMMNIDVQNGKEAVSRSSSPGAATPTTR